MKVMLNSTDFSKLKPETVADIFSLVRFGQQSADATTEAPVGYNPWTDPDFGWDTAADLSINQIQHFMETVSDAVAGGIKYIAINGPSVMGSDLLNGTDITALNAFQGATTKRTRSVTKVDNATLLGWDDWNDTDKYPDRIGQYGVTEVTFKSLRRFFGIG
jgi:hypothetical protein